MKCQDVTRDLPLLAYGELSFDDEERVERHLEQCGECRAEYRRLKALLAAADESEAEIPAGMLTDCRRRLRVSVAALSSGRPRGIAGTVRDFLAGDWSGWLKPAGAVALVAVGFFGARLLPDRTETQPIQLVAPAPVEPVASRIRYVEPSGDGQVQIVLEETRQRVLSGATNDDRIRRLLLTAARESADPGLRVESVDLLSSGQETDEIRRVLLYALQHDSNPGVRLKAIEGLSGGAGQPDVRKALARVLLTDDNPGVRTRAIDLLIQRKEPDVVDVLQEALRRDSNSYVRLKCQKALHDLRASAESF